MIYNVVLVSGVQQSDSIIHMYVTILFQVLFPFQLLPNIEQSSLCYTYTVQFLCKSIFSSVLHPEEICLENESIGLIIILYNSFLE